MRARRIQIDASLGSRRYALKLRMIRRWLELPRPVLVQVSVMLRDRADPDEDEDRLTLLHVAEDVAPIGVVVEPPHIERGRMTIVLAQARQQTI